MSHNGNVTFAQMHCCFWQVIKHNLCNHCLPNNKIYSTKHSHLCFGNAVKLVMQSLCVHLQNSNAKRCPFRYWQIIKAAYIISIYATRRFVLQTQTLKQMKIFFLPKNHNGVCCTSSYIVCYLLSKPKHTFICQTQYDSLLLTYCV